MEDYGDFGVWGTMALVVVGLRLDVCSLLGVSFATRATSSELSSECRVWGPLGAILAGFLDFRGSLGGPFGMLFGSQGSQGVHFGPHGY